LRSVRADLQLASGEEGGTDLLLTVSVAAIVDQLVADADAI
jgi:hypothetical protein